MKLNQYFKIIKAVYFKFIENETTLLSAQVSYYLILSFFPFLIFLVTLISYTEMVNVNSLQVLTKFLPSGVYQLVFDLIKEVLTTRNKALISIGMLATIWSASLGMLAFMYGMNRAYQKRETRPFWKVRAMSILFTIALSAILVFSFVLVVFGEILGRHMFDIFNLPDSLNIVWNMFRYIFSIITLLFVFVLFFVYIPNCKLTVKSVIPGALLSTIGWLLTSAGFAFYVNNFGHYSKIYGSIGAIIALLIWLYWSSIIVFLGSELNAVLYNPDCS